MTSQQYQTTLFEELDGLTLSAEDFRVRLSALRESGKDLKILEELYFLKSHGSHLFSDLACYSLRTSKDSSIMMGGIHSRPSSQPWMNWGMTLNGKCLTAKILESPKIGNVCSLSDILEENVPEEYFLFRGESQSISSQSVVKIGNVNPSGSGMNGEVYQADGLAPTLTTNKGEEQKIAIPVLTPDRTDKRQNGRRFKSDGEPMFTLTSQDKHGIMIREATAQGYAEAEIGDSVNLAHPNSKTRRGRVGKGQANTLLTGESQGVVTSDFRIRKLTPRECWRLQGFPDWAFDRAQEVNSNSRLYKQAGNSVTVNVIEAIARKLG